jgi:adenylate kinase family enzyme
MLDGFPRTSPQLDFATNHFDMLLGIITEASFEACRLATMRRRVCSRCGASLWPPDAACCPGANPKVRVEDSELGISQRYQTFAHLTLPMIELMKGRIRCISGSIIEPGEEESLAERALNLFRAFLN